MNSDQVQVKAPGWPWFYFIFIRELKTSKGKRRQVACKPGSVPVHLAAIQAMTIHLGCLLPDTSCDTPGRRPENRSDWQASPPSLFGLAPGGVYRAVPVTGNAVRSYRTLSPLPTSQDRRFAFCGTFPGVAPAGRYPAPFFRGARTFLPHNKARATVQPSGPCNMG